MRRSQARKRNSMRVPLVYRACSIEGCEGQHEAKGYCQKHYLRYKKWGDPLRTKYSGNEDRFWKNVDKTGACWLWKLDRNSSGHGRFRVRRKLWLAHRYAYTIVRGPIPEGLQVNHLCDNPACVKPSHLVLGDHQQNKEDRDPPPILGVVKAKELSSRVRL